MKYFLVFYLLIFSTSAEVLEVDLQDRRPEVYLKDHNAYGPIVDTIKELFEVANLKYDFHWVPWPRTLSKAKSGNSVILVRHSITDTRRSFLLPIPYGFETRSVFFFKNKKSKFKVESYDQLREHTIGFRNKSFYSPRFSNDKTLDKVSIKKDSLLIGMLQRNRIDLVVSNSIVQFKEMVKHSGLDYDSNFEPVKFKDTFPNGRYFSIPKNSKYSKYYKKLNCAMYKLRKNGKINYFFKNHGLNQLVQTFDDPDSILQKESCKK